MNIQLNQELAQKEKLRVEVANIEGRLSITNAAITWLESYRQSIFEFLKNNFHLQQEQFNVSQKSLDVLNEQKTLLKNLSGEQQRIISETEHQLQTGLVGKYEYQKQKQDLDRLRLAETSIQEKSLETTMSRSKMNRELGAYRNAFENFKKGKYNLSSARAVPEILALEKSLLQLEVELMELKNKRQILQMKSESIKKTLEKSEEIFSHLKSKPLYRAIKASTDVAFIPYSQIQKVRVADDVYSCSWLFFFCKKVGKVTEIIGGEVATQDPWGDTARGQYAILSLDEKRAIMESTLRVRRN